MPFHGAPTLSLEHNRNYVKRSVGGICDKRWEMLLLPLARVIDMNLLWGLLRQGTVRGMGERGTGVHGGRRFQDATVSAMP